MNGNASNTHIPPFLTDLLWGMVKRKPFVKKKKTKKKKREKGGFDFTSLRLGFFFFFILGEGVLHFFSSRNVFKGCVSGKDWGGGDGVGRRQTGRPAE